MKKAKTSPMLYKVMRATLEDEVKLRTGAVKKNVIVVLLKDEYGDQQRIFVTEAHEKARKKGADIPDFIANIGKVVSIETEQQVAGVTGYITKDANNKDVETIHDETKAQPSPFGYVGTDEDVQEYQSDLKANKADSRDIKNIKVKTHATTDALMSLDAKALEFFKENPILAGAITR